LFRGGVERAKTRLLLRPCHGSAPALSRAMDCGVCHAPLPPGGVRYKCANCPSFSACSACYEGLATGVHAGAPCGPQRPDTPHAQRGTRALLSMTVRHARPAGRPAALSATCADRHMFIQLLQPPSATGELLFRPSAPYTFAAHGASRHASMRRSRTCEAHAIITTTTTHPSHAQRLQLRWVWRVAEHARDALPLRGLCGFRPLPAVVRPARTHARTRPRNASLSHSTGPRSAARNAAAPFHKTTHGFLVVRRPLAPAPRPPAVELGPDPAALPEGGELHANYSCDGCGGSIAGTRSCARGTPRAPGTVLTQHAPGGLGRLFCVACGNYDLCRACYAKVRVRRMGRNGVPACVCTRRICVFHPCVCIRSERRRDGAPGAQRVSSGRAEPAGSGPARRSARCSLHGAGAERRLGGHRRRGRSVLA
jgi:hypothetical protein